MPMAAGTALASPLSGRLTAARGPRPPLVAAGLLIAVAALTLTTLTPTTPWAILLAAYVLLGIGFGLVNAPITSTAVAGMPRAQAGVSAAITTTGRQIGNNLGVAVLGSIVTARTHAPGGPGLAAASHPGWWILATGGLVITAIGLATTTARATATAGRIAARFPADPVPTPSTTPAVRDSAQT
jgi:MFS family permease